MQSWSRDRSSIRKGGASVDNSTPAAPGVAAAGLSVELQREIKVGSLRYFDAAGPFAAALRDRLGGPLPAPLRAVKYSTGAAHGELILAWRSPTETLLLTRDEAAFAALFGGVANDVSGGCTVDQTGGLWAWRVTGTCVRDLLLRLGSTASFPAPGEARSSRVAELPVLALCVQEGDITLLVERVYSDHLLGWIRETAADL
jgi:sarcosine oxidase gamma subunit